MLLVILAITIIWHWYYKKGKRRWPDKWIARKKAKVKKKIEIQDSFEKCPIIKLYGVIEVSISPSIAKYCNFSLATCSLGFVNRQGEL